MIMTKEPSYAEKVKSNADFITGLVGKMDEGAIWVSSPDHQYQVSIAKKELHYVGGAEITDPLVLDGIKQAGWKIYEKSDIIPYGGIHFTNPNDVPTPKELELTRAQDEKRFEKAFSAFDKEQIGAIIDYIGSLATEHLAVSTYNYSRAIRAQNKAIDNHKETTAEVNRCIDLLKAERENYFEHVRLSISDTYGHCFKIFQDASAEVSEKTENEFSEWLDEKDKQISDTTTAVSQDMVNVLKKNADATLLSMFSDENAVLRNQMAELKKQVEKLAYQQVQLVQAINKQKSYEAVA